MIKQQKKLVIAILLILAVVFLVIGGCAAGRQAAEAPKPAQPKQITAKLGHVGAPDHIFEIGARKFSELVLAKTNGQIKIETFPGAQLGGDRDVFEALRAGTVEFAIQGPIDSFVPITSVVNLPFLFNSPEHVYEFLDGDLGKQVFGDLEKMGIILLGQMENGWRLITSNRPINSIGDLRGMKLRVPQSPVFLDTFTALGSSPVPIPFPELYGALQQGVVDGQENPVFHIMSQRFYEVQDYIAYTRHIYMNAPLVASARFWQNLTHEQQEAIRKAAIEAVNYQRKVARDKEAALLKELDAKVTITRPDIAPFKKAVKPVHEAWAKKYGEELYQKIVQLGQ